MVYTTYDNGRAFVYTNIAIESWQFMQKYMCT